MQKWEYLLIHVESSRAGLLVSVNGNEVLDKKEFGAATELTRSLNSLGAEGWDRWLFVCNPASVFNLVAALSPFRIEKGECLLSRIH
jgi:hypothetical protein